MDLVNITMRFRPLPVLFGSVDANVPQIANQWQSAGTLHARHSCIASDDFVANDIENGRRDEGGEESQARILATELLESYEEVGDSHACGLPG